MTHDLRNLRTFEGRTYQRGFKPDQPTILRRSTFRNLQYLTRKGLIAVMECKFAVAVSLRKRQSDGTFIDPGIPSHGV